MACVPMTTSNEVVFVRDFHRHDARQHQALAIERARC